MTTASTPAPPPTDEELLLAAATDELNSAKVDLNLAEEALGADNYEAASAHSLAAIARTLVLITDLVLEDGLP